MKITFKNNIKEIKSDVLFVSVSPKNSDEIVKENGKKTLYLKCEESANMNLHKLFPLVRKMVTMAKNVKAEKIAFDFGDFRFSPDEKKIYHGSKNIKITDEELAEIIGTQLDFANYEFTDYKTPPKEGFSSIKEVFIIDCPKVCQADVLKGHTIAEEVNKTRTLANTPGGDMTPQILAQKAKEAVKGMPVKVTVLGEKEMEKQNMQAILSVGRGSDEESKFIIMEYMAGKKDKKYTKRVLSALYIHDLFTSCLINDINTPRCGIIVQAQVNERGHLNGYRLSTTLLKSSILVKI